MTLYIVEYEPGAPGCPVHLNGTGSLDWTWNAFDPELSAATPAADYVFQAKHPLVDFDYWDMRWMASEGFLEICRRFDVCVEGVPVTVIQSGGRPTAKQYFYLRWSSWASVVDRERSEVEWARDLRTGEPQYHLFFPEVPAIETVATFVVDEARIPSTAAS